MDISMLAGVIFGVVVGLIIVVMMGNGKIDD